MSVLSLSELNLVKSVLKNPDKDFNKIIDLIEKKLKQSVNRSQRIYENSIEGICILDSSADMAFINQCIAEILGYSREEMIGKSIFSLMGEKEAKQIKTHLEKRKEGISEKYEVKLRHKNGKEIYVQVKAAPLYDEIGNYDGSVAFIEDITEKLKTEQLLRESEEQFRTIAEQSLTAIGIFQENEIKYLNKAYEEFTGFSLAEMFSMSVNELIDTVMIPEERELIKFHAKITQSGERKIPDITESQVITKDGNRKWVLAHTKSITFHGRPAAMHMIIDITERRQAELKLKESEEQYRSLFENSPIALLDQDLSELKEYVDHLKTLGINDFNKFFDDKPEELLKIIALPKIIDVNKKTVEVYKAKSKEDFISRLKILRDNIVTNMSNEVFLYNKMQILSLINGNTTYDSEVKTKTFTEEHLYLYAKTSIVSGFESTWSNVIVTLVDITERKKIEEKLKESEAKYRSFLENFQGIAFQGDLDFTPIFFHGKVEEITGYEEKEFISQSPRWDQIILDEDKENLFDSSKKIHEIPGIVIEHEYRILAKNGKIKWIHEIISNICNENGKPYMVQGIINEITDRKNTEQALKESEEKYRNLVETSSMGLLEIDYSTKELVYINPKLVEILGYTNEELLKEFDYHKFIQTEDLEEMDFSRMERKLDFRVITKNGKIKFLSGDKLNYYDEHGALTYIRLWLQDITEEKNLEEIKANLIMRFSHEFKTPLISIKGFADLLLEDYRDKFDEKIISFLENIEKGADKLKNLINSFLESSQLDENLVRVKIKQVDISKLIYRVLSELEGVIKSRRHIIDLKIENPSLIKCDPEKFHVILSNLILNASKFTPRRGLIQISTATKNGFFIISVKDNGIGLPKTELETLFRPFGKIERYGQGLDVVPDGIGMGLYITKELVDLHKGKIWAESSGRNKGSTFNVKIPLNQ